MQERAASSKSNVDIQDALNKVAHQIVFFGHQSVGYNIIDGIKDISLEHPSVSINIIELNDRTPANREPAFMHAVVGHNTEPISKLKDFSRYLDTGLGRKVNIAFVKFCYVDITQGSDVQKIFNRYKETIDNLKNKYPNVTFVHLTAPLTSKQNDIKTLAQNIIKRIIARPVRSYKDNISRNAYNELLKREYEGKEPVFDLAAIESTLPDGSRVSYSEDGVNFYALAPEYTDDGGHLNKQGRRIVAIKLVEFLATLPANTVTH